MLIDINNPTYDPLRHFQGFVRNLTSKKFGVNEFYDRDVDWWIFQKCDVDYSCHDRTDHRIVELRNMFIHLWLELRFISSFYNEDDWRDGEEYYRVEEIMPL